MSVRVALYKCMANVHQRRRARLAQIRAEQAEAQAAEVVKAKPKAKKTTKKTTKKSDK